MSSASPLLVSPPSSPRTSHVTEARDVRPRVGSLRGRTVQTAPILEPIAALIAGAAAYIFHVFFHLQGTVVLLGATALFFAGRTVHKNWVMNHQNSVVPPTPPTSPRRYVIRRCPSNHDIGTSPLTPRTIVLNKRVGRLEEVVGLTDAETPGKPTPNEQPTAEQPSSVPEASTSAPALLTPLPLLVRASASASHPPIPSSSALGSLTPSSSVSSASNSPSVSGVDHNAAGVDQKPDA